MERLAQQLGVAKPTGADKRSYSRTIVRGVEAVPDHPRRVRSDPVLGIGFAGKATVIAVAPDFIGPTGWGAIWRSRVPLQHEAQRRRTTAEGQGGLFAHDKTVLRRDRDRDVTQSIARPPGGIWRNTVTRRLYPSHVRGQLTWLHGRRARATRTDRQKDAERPSRPQSPPRDSSCRGYP